MRVIMLSCNTGEGHNSTAKAIQEAMNLHGIESEIVDAMACLSPKFSKFLSNWHTRIYKYSPKLFDVGYRAVERSDTEPGETTPIYDLLAYGVPKLWELLQSAPYDAVLCTHPFSGMMMTEICKAYDCRIPCYFVATDYTCSPGVEQCLLDGYFIPSGELMDEFIKAGLPQSRLIPSGIPVSQRFYAAIQKTEARKKLNLPENGILVLLMGGSMGCGPMREIAENLLAHLPDKAAVAVICGKNEKLYESMNEIQDARVHVAGFTLDVPLYMDAADIIITKPGGLSSTEAANKHLPIVFINAVGGCENRNFNFFLASGYAIGSDDASEVIAQTVLLSGMPGQLHRMQQRLQEDFSVNSANRIVEEVIRAVTEKSSAQVR